MSKDNSTRTQISDEENNNGVTVPLLASEAKQVTLLSCQSSMMSIFLYSMPFFSATFFTLGKIIQAGGANLFGLEKMFEKYHWQNGPALTMMKVILLTSNGISTIANRGVKNFEYFLPPNISKKYIFSEANPTENQESSLSNHVVLNLSNCEPQRHLLRKNYIIISINAELNLYRIDDYDLKFLSNDQELLSRLMTEFNNDSMTLTRQQASSIEKTENKNYELLSYTANAAYWTIFTLSLSTMFFSTMAAYLSSDTLARDFSFTGEFKEFFIWYATAANFVSYGTFNMTTIHNNTARFCQSIENKTLIKDNFSASLKILLPVCLLTFLGMIANLAFAYYAMDNFFQMPIIQKHCPYVDRVSVICRYFNVLGTFFSGIFNMASGAYQVVENWSKGSQNQSHRPFSYVSLVLTLIVVTDTTINALNAFLGMSDIAETTGISNNNSLALIATNDSVEALFTASYDYLTSGMMRRGAEKFIQWTEKNVSAFFSPHDRRYKAVSAIENPLSAGIV